jgi:hypothetical protein
MVMYGCTTLNAVPLPVLSTEPETVPEIVWVCPVCEEAVPENVWE